jgi:hypothetical protein
VNDVCLNVGSKPKSVFGILHTSEVYSSVEVMFSVCEQKDLHIDLIGYLTQSSLNESPMSYPKTTMSSK